VEFTKVDTLCRYAEAIGANLRVEVEVGYLTCRTG
jgi:hypothetical protein